MSQRRIEKIQVKSALNQLKRKIPYGWDLNIYRGCEHGCQYCYAMYTHGYLEADDFHQQLFVKENILEVLEKELSAPQWDRAIVNIGGVTDSYQPIERDYQLMPEILKLFIKYKTPVIISTKSDLILRDLDLIDELSQVAYVNIAATVTTMDETIREVLEPGSARSIDRLMMLKAFQKTNATTGLHVMPIIPYLTDTYNNFNSMFKIASDINVDYTLMGTLYLRGKTKPHFLKFIKEYDPEIYEKLKALYVKGSAGKPYKNQLYAMVNDLRAQYKLSSSYSRVMKNKINELNQK